MGLRLTITPVSGLGSRLLEALSLKAFRFSFRALLPLEMHSVHRVLRRSGGLLEFFGLWWGLLNLRQGCLISHMEIL